MTWIRDVTDNKEGKTHNDEHPLVWEHFGNMDMSNAEEYGTKEDISGVCKVKRWRTYPLGAPINPLAQYQRATREVCSSLFHQEDVIRTKPGFKQDSKTPRKNLPVASVAKLVADPVAASVTPQRMKLIARYFPVGNFCIKMLVGYWAMRYPM